MNLKLWIPLRVPESFLPISDSNLLNEQILVRHVIQYLYIHVVHNVHPDRYGVHREARVFVLFWHMSLKIRSWMLVGVLLMPCGYDTYCMPSYDTTSSPSGNVTSQCLYSVPEADRLSATLSVFLNVRKNFLALPTLWSLLIQTPSA